MSSDVAAPPSPEALRAVAFAHHGHDWAEAARQWAAYRAEYPGDADGFFFGTVALRESGALDEAERFVEGAMAVFPDHPQIRVEHALVAYARRDWPEARTRFATVRGRFPGLIDGHLRGAEVAHNLGAREEALQLIAAGVARFPGNRRLLEDYAYLAERLADPQGMVAAWGEHRRHFGEEQAFCGEARGLADAGDPERAEAVLQEGLAAYPLSVPLAAELARVAVRRGDWPEVTRRWTALVDDPALGGEARSRLRDAERFVAGGRRAPGEAIGWTLDTLFARTWTLRYGNGQVVGQGIRLGPDGALLNHCGEARAWTLRDGCLCFLDDSDFITTKFTSVETGADGRLRLGGRDWIHPQVDSAFVLEETRPTVATILGAFESLGDNCEFGLVQRFWRAEPLGLLRFNATRYDRLLEALSTRFAAFDEPGYVRVTREPDGELVGHVDAYQFWYHTNRYEADVDAAALARAEEPRLRYLADLLLENIEDGRRIFVRKAEPAADAGKILHLHECLRRIGPDCTLLWVTEAEAGHPSGTVEVIGPRLMQGYIERLAPYNAVGRVIFDDWLEICTRAHRIVHPAAWG